MNLLGIDLKPLLNELIKFRKSQERMVNLLEENNQLNKQVLAKLGG